MRIKGIIYSIVFSSFLFIFAGCNVVDPFLPSSSAYKLNARVNNITLDECSFVTVNDKIQPFFEESVSNDPDITALLVFFRNGRGETAGWKVLYSLDGETGQDEMLIPVNSLDDNLPFVPIPANFPIGRYTLVSQVMSGKEVLQKTEKTIYYIGNSRFTYDKINVHLPGITDNSQIIPRGMVVLLEAKFNFESRLDPYIVWYSGKRKISEGRFSEGASYLLWKAPEQSGFYSVSVEIFPADSHFDLAGYKNEISLLVSTKTLNLNLVSENIPQLVHWYVFEGNLNDSKLVTSQERSLLAAGGIKPDWTASDGIYGLAAGHDRTYMLPKISGYELWQILFRLKPIYDGGIFYIQFSPDVYMNISVENQCLILTLSSPQKTVSQSVKLSDMKTFITAGVSFSVNPGSISAKINILGNGQAELSSEPLNLEIKVENDFLIFLGHKRDENTGEDVSRKQSVFTALWDEFAIYNTPPMERIFTDVIKASEFTVSEHSNISSN
jgi:hypothetical protein